MQQPPGNQLPIDQPHAEPGEYDGLFEALVFPVSKSAIMQKANDRGGIDSEVVSTLELLPDRTYSDALDLRSAVQAIYLERGVRQNQLPL